MTDDGVDSRLRALLLGEICLKGQRWLQGSMAFSFQSSGFGRGASGPGTVDLQIWQALAPRQSGADHGYQVAPGIETPVVICPVSPGQTVHLMARKTFQYVSRSDIAVHVAALGFELATRALAV